MWMNNKKRNDPNKQAAVKEFAERYYYCRLLVRMVSLLLFHLKVNKWFLSFICDQIHAQNIPNDTVTMFFCSESSLFVSKERVILKTCGQTTLLKCIKPLLELAKNECGLTEVQVGTGFLNQLLHIQQRNCSEKIWLLCQWNREMC